MFPPAINVEQIDEVFPTLVQTLDVVRNLFSAGELLVVGVDLILHPTQVFNSFTLARIEEFDLRFTLLFAQLQETLLFTSIDKTAIHGAGRNSREIKRFG